MNDAANKNYVDIQVNTRYINTTSLNNINIPNNSLNMNNFNIINTANPIDS